MSGHLKLNTSKPLLAYCLLHQIRLLADGCLSFSRRCIAEMEPEWETISRHLDRSLMLVTALAPHVGYERAAHATKIALDENKTLREAVLELELLSADQYDAVVDPAAMTGSSDLEK
ncbi:MAG: fumarate hydratase class II [Rhodothermales bacterium]|jgi:fumarate hydratase class II